MLEDVRSVIGSLRVCAGYDVSTLSGEEAAQLVEYYSEAERLAIAARTLAAGRVAETRAWASSSHRTAATWLASKTKAGLKDAIAALETARNLSSLPATKDAFVSGSLSALQTAEIAGAAVVDPSAEAPLLEMAATETVHALRERCREVVAAATPDDGAYERIRASRYMRSWMDRDGAVRLDARLTPDAGARLLAAVEASASSLRVQARRAGLRERADAYAADALVGLAGGVGVDAVVHVEVSQEAYARGYTEPGETSKIRGVGPVPVPVAHRLAAAGSVKVIERAGVDVTRVAHLGRSIPAHLRTALEARDPVCVVPGCDIATDLEIDHIIPFAEGGPTTLENLARICTFHHVAKTHHGWRLEGRPGAWIFYKVSDPEEPPVRGP